MTSVSETIRVDCTTTDGVTVLAAHGDLDLGTAGQVRRLALQQLAASTRLVVDLSGLGFLDSSGVGALIAIRREARAAGVALSVVCPPGPAHRVLVMMRVDQVLDLVASLEEALAPDRPG